MESSTATIGEVTQAKVSQHFGRQAILATIVAALAVGMAVLTLLIADGSAGNGLAFDVGASIVSLFSTFFGWLIIRSRPRNAVGWLLLLQSFAILTIGSTEAYAIHMLAAGGAPSLATRLAAVYSAAAWPLLFAGFAGIAYVFPDGRFVSKKYKRWGQFTAFCLVTLVVGLLLSSEPLEGELRAIKNPLPTLPPMFTALTLLFIFGFLFGLIASAFAVRARLRASTGDARIQILWLAYAALWVPATVALCLLDGAVFGTSGGPLTVIGLAVMFVMMPLAIAIGVLRYRLFDIELVINRTLVYGALTACIAAVYAAVIAGFDAVIGNRGLAGLLAVGVVAVMIQPLHARVQARVDRWIYGDRANPYAALQRLDLRLRETLTPAEVVQTVVGSVAEALRLPYAAVEFGRDDDSQVIASHGIVGRGELERRELSYRGERVGTLAVEVPPGRTLASADQRLLDDLASHVGVAVQSVSLTVELQKSRKDLVTAREEERRRLRRDLHDGVGPALAAMSIKLEILNDRVDTNDRALVEQLGGEVQETITDIRRLVYDLRPPALDEFGLVSALREQATRLSASGANFEVLGPSEIPQLPAAAEVATYRIALEAMTNVAKHAGAAACEVKLSLNGGIQLTVSDNGDGFAPDARHGVGMSSMRERASEIGGELSVETGRDGTVVIARLPLGPG
ncbi:MAG: histidine kinase [Solirubrobacterales bacterium]